MESPRVIGPTWALQSLCWDEEAYSWGHTGTLLPACSEPHTLSNSSDPRPTGGVPEEHGLEPPTEGLPPPPRPANAAKGSHHPSWVKPENFTYYP